MKSNAYKIFDIFNTVINALNICTTLVKKIKNKAN